MCKFPREFTDSSPPRPGKSTGVRRLIGRNTAKPSQIPPFFPGGSAAGLQLFIEEDARGIQNFYQSMRKMGRRKPE
jgi:hypothetical protein